MTKTTVRIWGVLAFLAPAVFIGGAMSIGQVSNPAIPVALANIYIFALAAANIVFAFKIPDFPGSAKFGWTILLLAFHAFAAPIFWYLYVRKSANEQTAV
ncbi:MAG: hypothetical protein QF803_08770 [Gammaproteobacteria bacterium]|nr:hypothetical protein [Gammaproteobacteria bacterium]